MTYLNTKNRGVARVLIFPFSKGYRAVCLDFNLIEDAKKMNDVEQQIRDSVIGYVENVRGNHLSDDLLNRHADRKYWEMFMSYQRFISAKRVVKVPRAIERSSSFSLPIKSLCPSLAG